MNLSNVKSSGSLVIVTRARGVFFKPLYESLVESLPSGWTATLIRPSLTQQEHPEELVTPKVDRITVVDVRSRSSQMKGDDNKLEKRTTYYETFWPSKELKEALESANPSLVLIHEFSPFTLYALYFAKRKGVPVVVSTEVGKRNASYFKLQTRFLHALWGSFVDGVVACCPAAHEPLCGFNLPTISAYHSVDSRKYVPFPKEVKEAVEFVYLGRYNRRKGLDLLIEAAALLKKRTSKKFRLKLIGYGDEEWLKGLIEEHNLGANTDVVGFLSGDALIEALGKSDVFVLPTKQDTYAAVVHEAACMGLPLIISRHAGACEALVQDGVNGYGVDPENTIELASAMERLLLLELRSEMSIASRDAGEKHSAHLRGAALWDWMKFNWFKDEI